jgi:hypothetical protein
MIQAMPGKVVIKKYTYNSVVKGIYMNTTNYYYQIESILENEFSLVVGDKIVVDEKAIYFTVIENTEYGFIELKDILAVIK